MARILVVDDEEMIRAMLRKVLERAGHEAGGAADGNEALRLQRENAADVVVTDIIMPDMDGTELIIILKREFPDTKIIAISGGGRIGPQGYLQLAKRFGADRTFGKPFEVSDFMEAVDEVLKETTN